eukprot:TRINITY_DN5469_c0_g2_i1.p1 TRINITY_DN5469_c0_g2~~TRINITY_DN5469_c0_g2_i1.p1  ORF type:complete len:1433 (-),score=437.82 TRINITY_DN5469_c0_g2_i1:35-4333(-)
MFLSNIFTINDVQEIRWSRFTSPFKSFSISSNEDVSSLVALGKESPLLASYLRLLSEGIPCVWFFTNQTQQELWTFELNSSNSQSLLEETNQLLNQLDRAETGVWSRSKHSEDAYVTELLFKAFKNRIEWLMSDRSFFKAGDSLICSQSDNKAIFSLSFDFFFHGNTVCFNAVMKQSRLFPYNWNSTSPLLSLSVISPNGTSHSSNEGKKNKGNTFRTLPLLFCGRQVLPCSVQHSARSEKEFNSVKRQWRNFFNWDADKSLNSFEYNSFNRSKRNNSHQKNEMQKMTCVSLSGTPYCLPTNAIFHLTLGENSQSFLNHTLRKQCDLESFDSSAFSNLLKNEGILPFGTLGKNQNQHEQLDWSWKHCDPFNFLDSTNSGLVLSQTPISADLSSPPAIPPSPSPSPIQKTPVQSQNFSPNVPEANLNGNTEDNKESADKTNKRKGERTTNKPNKKQKDEWSNDVDDNFSLDMNFNDSDFNSWMSTMVEEPEEKMEEEVISESQPTIPVSSTSDLNIPSSTPKITEIPTESLVEESKDQSSDSSKLSVQNDSQNAEKSNGNSVETEAKSIESEKPFAKSDSAEIVKPVSYIFPPSYAPVLSKTSIERYSYIPELKNSPASMRSSSPIYSEVSMTPPSALFGASSSSDSEGSDSESESSEEGGDFKDENSKESKGNPEDFLELEEFVKKTMHSSHLEPNSALVSLLLEGIYQPFHVRLDPTKDSQRTAAQLLNAVATRNNSNGQNQLTPEQCELNEHLSSGGYDGQPFFDINGGICAKLGVDYALRHRKRRKTRCANPSLWNMEWIAITEEPQNSAMDLVIYPLDELPEATCQDFVKNVAPTLQPLLEVAFSNGNVHKIERVQPLGLLKFCSLDSTHSEPLLLSVGEEDYAETLNVPNFIVGYQDEWISVQPNILNVWEKSRIEPYSQRKSVQYHVLAPNNPSIIHHFNTFFKELTSMYEICNFGKHQPSSVNNGITLVSLPVNNAQGVASAYSSECAKLGKQIMVSSAEYTEHSCCVIYIINPFHEIEPIREMLNSIATLIKFTSQHPNINLVFQIVPIQHTLQFTDLSTVLKELSFTVFSKVRRISSSNLYDERQIENRVIPPRLFEPLFILSSSTPPGANNTINTSPAVFASNPTTPLTTPVTPLDLSGNSNSAMDVEGIPNNGVSSVHNQQYVGREPILHCSYMLSEDERRLLCTFTDDRGELLESCTILIKDEGVNITVPKLFRRLWSFCKQNLAVVDLTLVKWKIVLGKFGELSPFELKEWKLIIQESLANKDDVCCLLESIVIVSLKFDRSLQLFLQKDDLPKNYNPSSSYAFFPKCPPHSPSTESPLGVSYIVTPIPTSVDQKPFDLSNRTAKLVLSVHWSSNQPKMETGFRTHQVVDVHEILRTITHQYFNLSWLTATPMWPRRRSTLPFHYAILKRMSRWSNLQS